jgi:hypothetical protein
MPSVTVSYKDMQAAAQFTQSQEEQAFLWRQINAMAERTKRGEITPMWFPPIDVISFSQSLCVTDVIDEGLTEPASQSPSQYRRL